MDTVKLKDISINNRGYYGIGASAVDYNADKYTYLRITDINDDGSLNKNGLMSVDDEKANQYLLQKNDIVFARTGASTGRNYFYDGEIGNIVYAGFLIKFSLNFDLVNPRYIKYYCLSQKYKDWILSSLTGSTRPNINEKQLADMPIELPEREYQDKVVEILDSLTSKIILNNEMNNNLYELAINYLNEKVEETEVPVSKFAKIQGGYAFKSKDLIDVHTKNRIIKIKNLRSEINADVINSQFVESEVVEKLDNKFRLSKGDVAIAMTGAELGKTGFIYGNDNYFLNQRVGVIRGKNKASELYLKILFLSDEFQTLLNSKGYGSAQPNVSTSDIENILINDITEDNLKKLYEIIKPIYEKIVSNSEEILNLEQLRDTLLTKIMNDEIDLNNVEI